MDLVDAYFENIALEIEKECIKAESSIHLAVAWLRNTKLFNTLVAKSRTGCEIILIIENDHINNNSKINFELLAIGSSKVYKVPKMHNKYCIIDSKTVITGSYNWTYNAQRNYENIVVIRDKPKIDEYIKYFKKIISEDEAVIEVLSPLSRIINHLNIIKKYSSIENSIEIEEEMKIISKLNINIDIKSIQIIAEKNNLNFTLNELYNNSLYNDIVIFNNEEIAKVKIDINELQNKLLKLENEKIEIDKTISRYNYRYNTELGDIILEILKCRKLKFNTEDPKFLNAEEKENEFKEIFNNKRLRNTIILSDEDTNKLKKLFKRAAMLCHPDKVLEKNKSHAEIIFNKLKIAYENNDITTITDILTDLENKDFNSLSKKDIDFNYFTKLFERLHISISKLEIIISELKNSDTYKKIISIEDWDRYFDEMKHNLKIELEKLHTELL